MHPENVRPEKSGGFTRLHFGEGLPAVCGDSPRVLILGSFPSEMSLARQEYYGNPQNKFWRIMGAV